MLEGYYIKKIGQNKGSPRVWLEGTQTARAGFEAGQRYDIVVKGQTVVLQANKDGIVAVDGNVQIQNIGRNEGVVHITNQLDITPKLGQTINIAYDKGRGTVVAREKHQFSLGL